MCLTSKSSYPLETSLPSHLSPPPSALPSFPSLKASYYSGIIPSPYHSVPMLLQSHNYTYSKVFVVYLC